MSARKSERLLNVVICLLVARTYVTKERIREVVEGYAGQTDDAFEKMFERDKDELRDLGIPIEMGTIDKFFSDDVGYRIRRDVFELPEVHLEPDEAAVLGVAARVWQHASLSEATTSAVLKLKAAGIQTDQSALSAIEPHVGASEPAFDPLWSAVVAGSAVRFEHLRSGASEPMQADARAVGDRLLARPLVRRRAGPRSRGDPDVPDVPDRRRREDGRRAGRVHRAGGDGPAVAGDRAGPAAADLGGEGAGADRVVCEPAAPRERHRAVRGGLGPAARPVRRLLGAGRGDRVVRS